MNSRKDWAERAESELARRPRGGDEDERAIRRRIYSMRAFQRRAATFGVVLAGLFFVINLMSSPGDWWVVWPLLGMGFFLAVNAVKAYGVDPVLGPEWEERKRQELRARFEGDTSA